MCFELDSRPPPLPDGLGRAAMGGAAAELVTLVSADGTAFSAALARPSRPSRVAVVILPDVRGLYRFYIELAERFALAGHSAIAIDYFGRTAGLAPRDEDFEYREHVMQTRPEQIQQDAAAALAELRERTGAAAVAVGFCLGGTQAFLAATSAELALDGVTGFYGSPDGSRLGVPSPADVVEEMRCPVLGLFGGADAAIPVEQVERFDERLTEAGVDHEIVVYPDAPHSFFDRRQEQYADASEDAWRRLLAFLDRFAQ